MVVVVVAAAAVEVEDVVTVEACVEAEVERGGAEVYP